MILCVCPNPSIDKLVFIRTFKRGATNRVFEEKSYPGGKGVHVAMGIKEMGEEVALLAFWGGASGKWIKEQCEEKGIACYGPTLDEWTRTCLTIKTYDEFDETEILGAGPKIDSTSYKTFVDDYKKLLKSASLVSMSGSWPMNDENYNFSNLISIAEEHEKKSIIDCSGASLTNALVKNPFGIHINHNEGYEIYNTHDPFALFSKLGEHSKLIAVTLGAKGLYLSDGEKIVHALSKVDTVISTVGCGDSLMAGLAVAHVKGHNLEDTAKLAASCGAANCVREDLGMFYKKDVELLENKCTVRLLDKNEQVEKKV
ncbi:1-phosphofructokinase family hexose kinase [Flagellimonas iocasae]|uniref:1-phosphofructokinase family hexose kinase n=1 Tax=Flagellimonas iocasae TaxID=2055905 RepID=A0ABW4Y547_9FLAO